MHGPHGRRYIEKLKGRARLDAWMMRQNKETINYATGKVAMASVKWGVAAGGSFGVHQNQQLHEYFMNFIN